MITEIYPSKKMGLPREPPTTNLGKDYILQLTYLGMDKKIYRLSLAR